VCARKDQSNDLGAATYNRQEHASRSNPATANTGVRTGCGSDAMLETWASTIADNLTDGKICSKGGAHGTIYPA